MAERDGDRDHVRPLPPWYAIDPADKFGEEIVGIQLLDGQLQERARPGELSRACGKQAQHARAKLSPRAFGIELLFGPEGLFEVAVDVGDVATDLAHGSSSTNSARANERVPARAEGLGSPRDYGGCEKARRGCARWARTRVSGPW
jgi:hypothetical protein